MTAITIDIPDSQLQKLQDLANIHGISLETLLNSSIEDWLNSSRKEFTSATNYVLSKNSELYQRLA